MAIRGTEHFACCIHIGGKGNQTRMLSEDRLRNLCPTIARNHVTRVDLSLEPAQN